MLRHLPLVRSIARTLRARLPSVEFEDLVSAGTIGLIEAVDRYDAERGVPFGSFAYPRIKGAIIDDVRRSGTLPGAAVSGQCRVEVFPLEGTVRADDELSLLEVTENPMSPEPSIHAELGELLDAVEDLPTREREMLGLQTRGFTVAQIGRLHGCSGSRVSQLISQARLRLEERTAA